MMDKDEEYAWSQVEEDETLKKISKEEDDDIKFCAKLRRRRLIMAKDEEGA